MNERLKQLAMLSNIEFTYDPTENPPKAFAECWEDELEKFAVLIVQECMNAVCDPRTTYLESMTEASAMYAAREKIRKHFGG
jgi:hypothetical protein